MSDKRLAGKVQTVLGLIEPEKLGITLPHEHFLVDQTLGGVFFVEPERLSERALAYQPVSLENLTWVRYHTKDSLDNQTLNDIDTAVKEATLFKLEGGCSIVDQTNKGLGRDPQALARISRATGLNIIMGSGYYADSPKTHDTVAAMSEEAMAEEIVADFIGGAEGTGIRAGIIGELGCSWPLKPNEAKGLRAGALAQQALGAGMNIHPGRNDRAPLEIVEILGSSGVDLRRVVMSHMDRCGYSIETRLELLRAGCFIEYDLFGFEGYYPARVALAEGKLPDCPNDLGRVKETIDLIERGYVDQVLMSHDIGMKVMLTRYGGWGYAHLLPEVVPLMHVYGVSDDHISTMMVDNSRRLLTIQ
ncbi:phosphotriesterase [Chloroflexota bacterium]